MSNQRWHRTPVIQNRAKCRAEGILADLEAPGQEGVPSDAPDLIATGELLKQSAAPHLLALIHEAAACDGPVDRRSERF